TGTRSVASPTSRPTRRTTSSSSTTARSCRSSSSSSRNQVSSSSTCPTGSSTSTARRAAMRVDVFTIFPEYLDGPLRSSLLGRARERGLVDVRLHDPRVHPTDPHRTVDDTPFGAGLLEYPQYTRPADFRGWPVPEALRSGDHALIARWRRAQALRRTLHRRPDLLGPRALTADERRLLDEFPEGPADR